MPTKLHQRFFNAAELPSGIRVAIYGSGDLGVHVAQYIMEHRDCTVPFFVDSFHAGEVLGRPVHLADALPRLREIFDLVLIASFWWFDIETTLQKLGVEPYVILGSGDVSGVVYTPEEQARLASVFGHLESALSDPLSKETWRGLHAIRCQARDARDLALRHKQAPWRQPLDRQYLDAIVPEAMRVVVEGGVFDGKNSLDLLAMLSKDAVLFGFEPDESGFRQRCLPGLLDDSRFRLVPMALWESEVRLPMLVGPGGGVVGHGLDFIEAIDLDTFVQRNSLATLDYVKLDVEGAEGTVLRGGMDSIVRHRPQLAVSIYHSKSDMYDLPQWLVQTLPDYVHFCRHYTASQFETVWYAIPRELAG